MIDKHRRIQTAVSDTCIVNTSSVRDAILSTRVEIMAKEVLLAIPPSSESLDGLPTYIPVPLAENDSN